MDARRVTIMKSLLLSIRLNNEADPLATRKELSDFLAAVERRAFKQAMFAVRDDQVALDAVQVVCGSSGMPTATVRLRCPDGELRTQAAVGTGPVHGSTVKTARWNAAAPRS